jgi:FkbM family methyltransferase
MKLIETNDEFTTWEEQPYGKISIYNNDYWFINSFRGMSDRIPYSYQTDRDMQMVKKHIPKYKNIIEIGAHCGIQTLFYKQQISSNCKYYAFEPQTKIYKLLRHNIDQNKLNIKTYRAACFCFTGYLNLNDEVEEICVGLDRKTPKFNSILELEQNKKMINYGGVCIGTGGEKTKCYKLDNMGFDNIGFIHSDAQGAEPYLFYGARKLIKRNKPVIFFENIELYGKYLYKIVQKAYPKYEKQSGFNIIDYCMNDLKYSKCINMGQFDTLLIP